MLSQLEISRAIGGRFFRVVFVKRTDGSVRTMRARLGVKKYLSGGGAKYSFASKGLLSVWDLDARGYRCVPLDAVMEFKCGQVSLTEDGHLGIQDRREEEHDRRRVGRVRRDKQPQGRNVRLG